MLVFCSSVPSSSSFGRGCMASGGLSISIELPQSSWFCPTMSKFNPAMVREDMPAYIDQVVDMLRSTRLLRP